MLSEMNCPGASRRIAALLRIAALGHLKLARDGRAFLAPVNKLVPHHALFDSLRIVLFKQEESL
jgi:hypothetical protein